MMTAPYDSRLVALYLPFGVSIRGLFGTYSYSCVTFYLYIKKNKSLS